MVAAMASLFKSWLGKGRRVSYRIICLPMLTHSPAKYPGFIFLSF